ncbi:MAG: dCTP deaminase [Planctomycetes bacterium RBG_13_44_8b]|nr:MAG: dCTP deaminase [Planctomycetes bacterium RBG_13_44_8b]
MSVLSAREIERRLKEPLINPESMVITPLLDEKFDHDAVDLRLGCYFRFPAISSIKCMRPYSGRDSKDSIENYPELVHKTYGRGDSKLILQPHHAVLAGTLEYIKMPGDVSGEILTKSSWARVFISIASAPWIHPFYRGCLTIEITNQGNVPVELPVGKPIAQLVFMRIENPEQFDNDLIEGAYAGAITPESPKFK